MLQIIEGTKSAFSNHQVPNAKTLSTPEYDKAVLWNIVKNDVAFRKFIPENLMDKPRRMPKPWLWRLICAYDPQFAEAYANRARAVWHDKMRTKKKETITMTEENRQLFHKLQLVPAKDLLIMPRVQGPREGNSRPKAKAFNIPFGKQ